MNFSERINIFDFDYFEVAKIHVNSYSYITRVVYMNELVYTEIVYA